MKRVKWIGKKSFNDESSVKKGMVYKTVDFEVGDDVMVKGLDKQWTIVEIIDVGDTKKFKLVNDHNYCIKMESDIIGRI